MVTVAEVNEFYKFNAMMLTRPVEVVALLRSQPARMVNDRSS